MAAPRPAARATMAFLSICILALQLLLAGMVSSAMVGSVMADSVGGPAVTGAPPSSADAAAVLGVPANEDSDGDLLPCDAGGPAPASRRPESHAALAPWTGGAAVIHRPAERSPPPARAPPA